MNSEQRNNQQNRERVWHFWHQLTADAPEPLRSMEEFCHPEIEWHGFHPLRRLQGCDALRESLWRPLLRAFPDLVRRPYLFLAGQFEGSFWVAGTGDFVGTFARDWLGISPSGTSVSFRFGEFCRLEAGRIIEIRSLIDLPDLMRQTGIELFPPSPGLAIWPPGPSDGKGILLEPPESAESEKTLALVESMIFDGLNRYDQQDQASQGLERFWHPQMVWHGPYAIGSAYGLDEFKANAQGPIVRAFPDRKGVGHRARIAEGGLAASTGWPSLVGTHTETFMGLPATGEQSGWNIMDFWKRDGDLLRENWVLIDLIDVALQAGVELRA